MAPWSCWGAAVCAATVLALSATAARQQPVFRSGIDLVTVDVTVLDGSGSPVAHLAPDRFTVRVDGAPRRVVSVEFISHRPQPLVEADAADHYSSNEHVDSGRLVMVVVDQMHIRRVEGRSTLRAAASFIDTLDRHDRVAAAPLDHGGAVEFTTDHGAVKRYLQRLTGTAVAMPTHFKIGLSEALAISDGSRTILNQAAIRECNEALGPPRSMARIASPEGAMMDPCPIQVEQEARAVAQMARAEGRIALDSLTRLISRLAGIDGQKTLVLVSEGLVAEPQLLDLTALGAAALAARVTLYVLQLEAPVLDAATENVSPTLFADMQLRADGLARLAGSARGAHLRIVGPDPYPFTRILREISGYYLVAFEAAENDRDGELHRIDVTAESPGATVRSRPSFRIAAPTPAATESDLVRLLRNPRIVADLPLRAAAYVFREPHGQRIRMVVSAETETPGREVTIGYVVVGGAGVIAASGAGRTESGRYSVPVVVPPGRYTLRVAAIDDPSGRRGSIERTVDAVLRGQPGLQVSDLMIAEPPSRAGGAVAPAVVRAGRERAVAYFEAYTLPSAPQPAPHIEVRVQRDGDHDAVATVLPVPAQAAAGRWTFTAELPVRDLAPGTYVAMASVPVPGTVPVALARRFVITK